MVKSLNGLLQGRKEMASTKNPELGDLVSKLASYRLKRRNRQRWSCRTHLTAAGDFNPSPQRQPWQGIANFRLNEQQVPPDKLSTLTLLSCLPYCAGDWIATRSNTGAVASQPGRDLESWQSRGQQVPDRRSTPPTIDGKRVTTPYSLPWNSLQTILPRKPARIGFRLT